MPNLVVTSTTDAIKVDFGDYSGSIGYSKGTWPKKVIELIRLNTNHIEMISPDNPRWIISHTSNSIGALIVDSVDAVAPSSLSDLYDKISALVE